MRFSGLDRNGILHTVSRVRMRLSVTGMGVVGAVSAGNGETRNLLEISVEGAQ